MSDKSKMFTAFSSPEKNSLDLPVHIEYSQKMYFNTVNLLMDKVDDFLNLDEVECTAIKIQVENIIEQLQQEQEMLLGLANSSYSYVLKEFNESNHYLAPIFIHSLNVTIYALKISIDLGIPEERLTYIGIASLLHNLGLLNAPKKYLEHLSESVNNKEQIKEYEAGSPAFFDKIKILDFDVSSLNKLIHYVSQYNAGDIGDTEEITQQYAMIIRVCNTFEMLTHQKTYGKRYSPIDAMKKMKDEMQDYFNHDIVKLFFNKLSIYPLGTFVELNSKEKAKIVGINNNYIMRPVILKILDYEGHSINPPERINLREAPALYIKHAIVDDNLTEKYITSF